MMHVDMSKMLEAEGYKVTELHSGDYKTEWSPYKPLTDGAQADMQVRLDATHAKFLSAISSGRGNRVTAAMRASKYGGGRMHSAEAALAAGLVDRLAPTREFYKGPGTGASLARSKFASTERARLELQRLRITSGGL